MNALVLASEAGNGKWLPHDINEVIWGSIAFFLVFGLLVWKAGPFVKKGLAARPERISGELSAAAEERAQAEAERDRIKAALADSDAEAQRIIAEARESAQFLTQDTEQRAQREAEEHRVRAAADLDTTRRQATGDLTSDVSRLALGAAEKVVVGQLDDATHQQLIEAYIAQVGTEN